MLSFLIFTVLNVTAQCWYVDDVTDSVCTTDPDVCIAMTYPDGSPAQSIEALSIDPSGAPVYASDGGHVGILDPVTGIFTPFANASGYADLDGLAWDPIAGKLYASVRSGGNDEIVCIETTGPNAGLPVAGTEVEVTGSGSDVDELTIAPPNCAETGIIYATISTATGFVLATIDGVSGVATEVGPFGISDVESITFDANCTLYANNGSGELYEVDIITGAVIGDPLIDVAGNDVEGMSCETSTPFGGSISNMIWEDLNGDGIQDFGEVGIPGVIVNLLDDVGNPVTDASGNPITATTDANGEYLFDNLPAGDYTIEIDPSNFTGVGVLVPYIQTFDEDGGGDGTIDVSLETNEDHVTADFGFAPQALPIVLSRFIAREQGANVTLEWSTLSEVDSDYFSIENSGDGENFRSIGRSRGATNSRIEKTYNFTDKNVPHGQNYYRIKHMDFNGTSSYSEIRSVRIKNSAITKVYPNPSNQLINIHIKNPENHFIQVKITNNLGRTVWKSESDDVESNWQRQVEIDDVGQYFIFIQIGKNISYERVIITR